MQNRVTTIMQIEPARARAKKPDKIWNDPEWIAEEKLDGWRFLLHVGRDLERPHLTGRRTSSVTGLFSEKGLLVPELWPEWSGRYTVIDGEILPPSGANFRDLASIMNATPEVAARNVERLGAPTFAAFDVLWDEDRDLRGEAWLERRQLLEEIVDEMSHELISVVPTLSPSVSEYERIVAAGGEGVILKNWSSEYGDDWIKVKRSHALDVVVTGFTDAKIGVTGKYLGLIGAVRVSVFTRSGSLIEVGKVSGMDDATRREITENRGRWMGTVIEIAAQGWGRDRLRHPRFKRHRPDAEPRSATFEKMMSDLGVDEVAEVGQLSLL